MQSLISNSTDQIQKAVKQYYGMSRNENESYTQF